MKSTKKTILLSLILLTIGFVSCNQNLSEEWFKAGDKPENYKIGLDNSIVQNGERSAYIESTKNKTNGFGTLMQTCNTVDYSGKRIKITGYIKTENVTDWSGMWLRIDPIKSISAEYFDNMGNRPIKGTTNWTKYKIVLDVPTNSNSMNFGVLLKGNGKVWIDNLNIEIIGTTKEKFNDSLNVGVKQIMDK